MTITERCPYCEAPMVLGRMAVNAHRTIPGPMVVWEPGHGIVRHGEELLGAHPFAMATRPAWRCPACEAVVLPPPEGEA